MAKSKEKKGSKRNGRFQWFLFIVIPVVFAFTITLVVLTISGVDIAGTVKKSVSTIPIISKVIDNEEANSESKKQEQLLLEKLEAKEEEINHLEEQNQMNERTIEELNQDIVKLKNRITQENQGSQESMEEHVKNISRSFNEMDAQAAAAIVDNLEQEAALTILENIPMKERGAILEVMDPVQAAELTNAFLNPASEQ